MKKKEGLPPMCLPGPPFYVVGVLGHPGVQAGRGQGVALSPCALSGDRGTFVGGEHPMGQQQAGWRPHGHGQVVVDVMAAMTAQTMTTTVRTISREQMMFHTLARPPCRWAPSRSPSTLQSRACGGKWGGCQWGGNQLVARPGPGVAARWCWDLRDPSPRDRG